MLSPSSICTSALASGPRPMPPYSFGTHGHHRPCARAFLRSGPSTSASGLVSSSFSAGMHSSCTHLRTFSRIALASAGISKSIDMAFPHGSCWVGLAEWHKPVRCQRQPKQSLKQEATAAKEVSMPDLADLFPGYASEWINTSVGPHLCPRRRQGTAAVVAARIFLDACDVASGGAEARRQVHADHRRSAGLWLVRHARERRETYALHQARDGEGDHRGDGATRPCALCARRP